MLPSDANCNDFVIAPVLVVCKNVVVLVVLTILLTIGLELDSVQAMLDVSFETATEKQWQWDDSSTTMTIAMEQWMELCFSISEKISSYLGFIWSLCNWICAWIQIQIEDRKGRHNDFLGKTILVTSNSTYQVDQNILSHPQHLNFSVFSWPKYSFTSLKSLFLHINSTKIFFCILHTSIFTYRNLHFFVSTWPEYSIASLTPPLLRFYSTRIFFCILTSLILCIYSTRIFYRILDMSMSLYLLDRNILSYPRHLHFWYLLDRKIPSHPQHLHFFVSTWPEYSIASSKWKSHPEQLPLVAKFSTRSVSSVS